MLRLMKKPGAVTKLKDWIFLESIKVSFSLLGKHIASNITTCQHKLCFQEEDCHMIGVLLRFIGSWQTTDFVSSSNNHLLMKLNFV